MVDIQLFFYGFLLAALLCFLIAWLYLQNTIQQFKKIDVELAHLKEKLEISEDERLTLSEKQELFQKIFDASPSVIYVKNLKGQSMLVNLKFQSVVDKSKDDILGKTDYEYMPALVAKRMRDNDFKVIEAEKTIFFEESVPLPGETKERTFFSVKFPLRDKSGRVYAVGGISTDITEKKETEERLNLALSASGMGTFFWEMGPDLHEWSEQTRALYGLGKDTPISFDLINNLIHPDDREDAKRISEESILEGKDYYVEYRVVLPNGSYRWIALRARPFLDSFGKPMQLMGVCWDISKFKENEQQLKETMHAREEFLKVISHEIKTPLSSLMLQIQMTQRNLVKGDPNIMTPERLTKFIESTEFQMDRLVKSVEKILN